MAQGLGPPRLVEQALEHARARVRRGTDEDALIVVAEDFPVASEELRLGERPAALRLEQQAVTVEDDGGGRRGWCAQADATRTIVLSARRSSAWTASSMCSGFVSSSFVCERPRRLWTKIITVGTPARETSAAS